MVLGTATNGQDSIVTGVSGNGRLRFAQLLSVFRGDHVPMVTLNTGSRVDTKYGATFWDASVSYSKGHKV